MEAVNLEYNNVLLEPLGLDYFTRFSIPMHVKKGTVIFEQGELVPYVYFVESGLIRQFYYKNDGKEITEYFAMENGGFSSFTSVFENKVSHLTAVALEDSVIYKISSEFIESACERYPELGLAYRKLLEKILLLMQIRMKSILCESAVERYETLLKHQPEIIKRASSIHIASYLGITPETLSRIRAK